MNENDNYESVTEYLMESESPQPLNEEQSYALLVEHFGEELVESMTDEERQDFATIVEGIIEGIGWEATKRVAKRKAGEARTKAGELATAAKTRTKSALKTVGKKALSVAGTATNIATLGAAQKIGKVGGRIKKAVGAEIEKERAGAAKVKAGKHSEHSPEDKAKAKKTLAAHAERTKKKTEKKPGILGRAAKHFSKGIMHNVGGGGTPMAQHASTVYDRIGKLIGETELTQLQKQRGAEYKRGEHPVKTEPVPKKPKLSLGKVPKK